MLLSCAPCRPRRRHCAAVAGRLSRRFDTGAETEAKADIWANLPDFSAKMKDLERESAALAVTAKAGDEAAIKDQFGKTGAACKACHDKYKTD
jgi:cytochrome c556